MTKKILFMTAAALATLFAPAVAMADMAPSTSDIGSLQPPQESKIQMASETVSFTIPANLKSPFVSDTAVKLIPTRALFMMKNPTKAAMKQHVIFPVTYTDSSEGMKQYAKNVRVYVNGYSKQITATKGTYRTFDANGKEIQSPMVDGYAFDMTIPALRTIPVVVRFNAPVGYNYFNDKEPTVNYLLASGAGWAGNIGSATFKFIYPSFPRAGWVAQEEWNQKANSVKAVGHSVNFTYLNFEPTVDSIPHFVFLTPAQAKANPKGGPVMERSYPGCDAAHPENCP